MERDGIDVSALLNGKEDDELRLVGCFLNDMTMMSAVSVNSEMLYFDMTKTIFMVLSRLYEGGFGEISRHSVAQVLDKDKDLYADWQANMLSYDILESLKKEYSGTENEVFQYFQTVIKTHVETSIYINNIKTNIMLATNSDMVSLEDLKSILEYNTNGIFLQGMDCNERSLEFTPEDMEKLMKGGNIGVSYGLPFMSSRTNGLHLGGLNGLAGAKGTGKSTTMLTSFLMDVVMGGDDAVLVSNEMTEDKIKNILIPFILATMFGCYGLSRTKFMRADFSTIDDEMWADAVSVYNQLMERITFIWLKSFKKENLLGIVRKYAKQGKQYFFFDTFKSDFESGDNLTVNLMNIIQNLSQECIDLNVFGLFTMQLKTSGKHRRYLDDTALARCTEAGQDLDTLWLMRDMFDDEYTGEGYDVTPYVREKVGDQWVVRAVKSDPDKKYMLMFLDKNRYGEDGIVTFIEKNTSFSQFLEKGYANVKNSPTNRGASY